MLDDAKYAFTYNFEKPAFPVKNYIATLRLYPVTQTDQTFAEWEASFDEAPGDEGKYEKIVSREVLRRELGQSCQDHRLQAAEETGRRRALEGLRAQQGLGPRG